MRHSIFLMNPIGSVENTWGGRFLNEAYLRCTYLRGRLHVLAGTVARTCKDGCTYLRGRMHVLAGGQIFSPQTFTMTDANVCGGGCKRLRERLQTFASERVKLALKSLVRFWIREKAALEPQWFPLSGGSFAPVLWRTALQAAVSD